MLFSDQIPGPRDVVIIGLAHACDIFKEILSARELARVSDRIDQVAKAGFDRSGDVAGDYRYRAIARPRRADDAVRSVKYEG